MLFRSPHQSSVFPRMLRAALFLGALLPVSSTANGQARTGTGAGDAIERLQAMQPQPARTRVLVMATFHMKQLGDAFQPAMLDSLIGRLERFRPDSICIETLPGTRVQELELRKDAGPLYADVLDGFASKHLTLGKQALDVLGTTPQSAMRKVREMLVGARAAGPAKMTPAQRATLALWMLAA